MAEITLAVAVAQFAPGADRDANLATIEALARSAAERGARLVVFPEYSSYFTPHVDASWLREAEPLDGAFVRGLAALASDLGVFVVAGMVEQAEGSRFFNTLVALRPDGELAAVYRKMHLYDAFGQRESDFVAPGPITEPAVFDVHGFTVGMQTCYDVRFPEVTRRLVDAGADLVVIPAEWVRGPLKEHQWRTLVTARALENTIYVAAADHAPPVGVGNSLIIDPMGVPLVSIGDVTDVAVAWISSTRIAGVREINPALRLRRFRVSPA